MCPWATAHSRLLSRKLDRGDDAREADVLCYVAGDTLGPCESLSVHGVVALEVPDAAPLLPLPPAALAAGARFSPTDAARTGPHKYFLAEVYSGASKERMAEKVAQLETLCSFVRSRWLEQAEHVGVPIDDITELVGAAALVFSAGDTPRRLVLERTVAAVRAAAVGPNLSRLARARRLLVIVLDTSQSPVTFSQRAVAARLEALDDDLAGLRSAVGALKGDFAGLCSAVARIEAALVPRAA